MAQRESTIISYIATVSATSLRLTSNTVYYYTDSSEYIEPCIMTTVFERGGSDYIRSCVQPHPLSRKLVGGAVTMALRSAFGRNQQPKIHEICLWR